MNCGPHIKTEFTKHRLCTSRAGVNALSAYAVFVVWLENRTIRGKSQGVCMSSAYLMDSYRGIGFALICQFWSNFPCNLQYPTLNAEYSMLNVHDV